MGEEWTVALANNHFDPEGANSQHQLPNEETAKRFAREKLALGHVVKVSTPTGKTLERDELIRWLIARQPADEAKQG